MEVHILFALAGAVVVIGLLALADDGKAIAGLLAAIGEAIGIDY